jgi:hypothetical protein
MTGQTSRLFEDSLTLFNRGYPGYALMHLLLNEETPRHFVMRCKAGFNKEVKQFERNIEPVRPGRHNPGVKKAKRLNGK